MKSIAVALFALVALSSGASAQNGANHFAAAPPNVAQYPASSDELQPGTTRLQRSANDCAPDMPRAVWGPTGGLLGYSCYSNPNGN
jgi:hypothetical protein